MSKKTHQQQLAARKAQRQAERAQERARQRRMLAITITAIVSVVVVIVGAVLIAANTGGKDTPVAGESPSPAPTTELPATAGPDNKPKSIPTALAPPPKRPTALPAEVDCSYPKGSEPAAKKVDPPANGKVKASGTTAVTLKTSVGDLGLTLDSALAPCTVKSFVSLVNQKYFDNTICHRLTVGEGLQVLQCGDPSGSGSGGPGYSFKDEVFPELKYGRGTLAMANSGPNTNGSQFFVVWGDGSALDPAYTAFGTIDEAGLKAIDKVANAGVIPKDGPTDGAPGTEVRITAATTAAKN
ncbi:peptidyl-prolyl cis-trans isomerase cyclophilin type [Kribbella flavida DSM 17836]|uniref:Peptidyl-prolyl cis-trans isomerase n=1 Tax=Kribbella flavida (strain DSM 17836 / JCM 10339 / NBRC 14399) TaxID=479435 RepID=D2PKJ0_KRIFD|nr:peptidylprolyl isomerase [Kribbella flavida]ADB30502.1 peptidyl-prolyl cis-trans isomerase cyclophilin type [Kribbella flavida DSM 17836]